MSKTKKLVKNTQQNSSKGLITHQQHYRGPIPQPSDLQQYENIKIGFAERIVKMAEQEATHRQKIDNKIINSERFFNVFGQLTAVCMGFSVIALYGMHLKGYAEQVKWIGLGIASVIGLFIFRRK